MSHPRSTAHGLPTHLDIGWVAPTGTTTQRDAGHGWNTLWDATTGHASGASAPGSRQALCLWLPTFELRLELIRSPDLDTTSVALLSPGESVRRTLWQVSERAFHQGVRPGQLVSQAISLCPSLTLLDPDPAHYDAAQEVMVEVLSDLTPVVEPVERGRVFLGMDGLARLHGSPLSQAGKALRALFGIFPPPIVAATRAGWASGKFGAWVAAASARPGEPAVVPEAGLVPFLAARPVGALPVSEAMLDRLERLGVATLGQLTRLPEAALVEQFGAEGSLAHAWATGRRIDPVLPSHRPRPIRVSLDFPVPVGQAETLHGAIDRMLERALARPDRRGRSVLGVRLAGHLEGGGSWTLEVVLRESTSRREDVAFPLRSRMGISPPPRAVETLVLENLMAVNDALGLGYKIHYWRTSDGTEVDFVLYGNRGFLAIEVKRGRRVSPADVAGLRSFSSDYPMARAMLIYSGERRLNVGGVDTRPLGDFLKRLPEILQE